LLLLVEYNARLTVQRKRYGLETWGL